MAETISYADAVQILAGALLVVARRADEGFHAPLDLVDGAARVPPRPIAPAVPGSASVGAVRERLDDFRLRATALRVEVERLRADVGALSDEFDEIAEARPHCALPSSCSAGLRPTLRIGWPPGLRTIPDRRKFAGACGAVPGTMTA